MPTKALLARRAWLAWQARQALQAWQDLLEQLDPQGLPDPQGLAEQQVRRDCKAWLALTVKLAPRAHKAHRVLLDQLV